MFNSNFSLSGPGFFPGPCIALSIMSLVSFNQDHFLVFYGLNFFEEYRPLIL